MAASHDPSHNPDFLSESLCIDESHVVNIDTLPDVEKLLAEQGLQQYLPEKDIS